MADEPMPLNEGAQLRELLRRIRDERVLVYSEGPDHLAMQECKIPFDPVRAGLRRHKKLFVALASEDDQLNEEQKREILRHDCRVGFQPPGDWRGAARELRKRCGMYTG
jgi:hypothetical protein